MGKNDVGDFMDEFKSLYELRKECDLLIAEYNKRCRDIYFKEYKDRVNYLNRLINSIQTMDIKKRDIFQQR